ncbi:MAG: acyltransferase family protein [Acidimicrobiia bacterium]
MGESTTYRSDIQALRGVAIVAVLSHHVGLPGLTLAAGYRGVDLFFVISGYVIAASLLDREARGERIRVGAFLVRRIRRLFPAFFVTVIATLLVGLFVQSFVREFQQTAQTGAAATLLVANYFLLARTVDYFTPLFPNPLLHMWSLSVEEQFYVVFALALSVASIWRLGLRSRTLRLSMPIVLVASWAASQWPERLPNFERYFTNQDLFPFYSFHSRAWQILAGVVVAQHADRAARLPPWLRVVVRLAGMGGLGGALAIGGREHHIGRGALVVTLATMATIAAGSPPAGTRVRAAAQMLTAIGDRSYALYLVHWPVILIGTSAAGTGVAVRGTLLAISVGLADLVHRRVEFAWQHDAFVATRTVAVRYVGGIAVLIGASLALRGIAERAYDRAAAAPVWERIPAECVRQHERVVDELGRFLPSEGGSTLWCSEDDPTTTIGFALEGDSHGGSLVRELLAAARELDASARLFTMTRDGPSGPAARHLVSTLDRRSRWVVGSYFRQNIDVPTYEQHLVELSRVAHVAALVVYLDNPFIETWRAPSLVRGPVSQSRARSEELRPDDRRRMLEQLAPTLTIPLVVVDPFDAVCDETTCFGGRDGLVWYIDEDHLSVGGVRQLQAITTQAFRRAVEEAGLAR